MSDHILHLPDTLYQRIGRHAKPFIELTPLAVIERWADYFDAKLESPSKPSLSNTLPSAEGLKRFNPLQPPDLFHTRAQGVFGGASFSNWNHLLRVAHIAAFAKAGSFEELRKVTSAKIRKGSYSESGFRHLPEIDISIQGADANRAWDCALRLARFLETKLYAEVEWRENEGAAHPGVMGVLEWVPS